MFSRLSCWLHPSRLVASHAQYRPKVRILNGSASDEPFSVDHSLLKFILCSRYFCQMFQTLALSGPAPVTIVTVEDGPRPGPHTLSRIELHFPNPSSDCQ
jgi:hypothetical protein